MESLWIASSFPDFNGSSSMISFENGLGAEKDCDDDGDRSFLRSVKKRRLSGDQVRFLEKSFESENKLEPERKARLSKVLGLEPKQVAIWFQNRRAQSKTKRLEKDYGLLKSGFDELGLEYDDLAKEVEKLKEEVMFLKDKLRSGIVPENVSEISAVASLVKSDVIDPDGSDYAAHANSVRERTADSSRVFESDVDDDADFRRIFLPALPTSSSYSSKLEDGNFENPRAVSASSGNFGFNVEDDLFYYGFNFTLKSSYF